MPQEVSDVYFHYCCLSLSIITIKLLLRGPFYSSFLVHFLSHELNAATVVSSLTGYIVEFKLLLRSESLQKYN